MGRTQHCAATNDEQKIFVIRPSESLNISRLEKDPEMIQRMYELGLKDGKAAIAGLREYLAK